MVRLSVMVGPPVMVVPRGSRIQQEQERELSRPPLATKRDLYPATALQQSRATRQKRIVATGSSPVSVTTIVPDRAATTAAASFLQRTSSRRHGVDDARWASERC